MQRLLVLLVLSVATTIVWTWTLSLVPSTASVTAQGGVSDWYGPVPESWTEAAFQYSERRGWLATTRRMHGLPRQDPTSAVVQVQSTSVLKAHTQTVVEFGFPFRTLATVDNASLLGPPVEPSWRSGVELPVSFSSRLGLPRTHLPIVVCWPGFALQAILNFGIFLGASWTNRRLTARLRSSRGACVRCGHRSGGPLCAECGTAAPSSGRAG